MFRLAILFSSFLLAVSPGADGAQRCPRTRSDVRHECGPACVPFGGRYLEQEGQHFANQRHAVKESNIAGWNIRHRLQAGIHEVR